jgi:hypothetical protein
MDSGNQVQVKEYVPNVEEMIQQLNAKSQMDKYSDEVDNM